MTYATKENNLNYFENNNLIIMEKEFILLKPDAVQRGLIGELISRFEKKGLRLIGMKLIHVDNELAQKHYLVHKGKPFFDKLVEFITSGPVLAIAVVGNNAVSVTRTIVGGTNPAEAAPGTIRGDFGLDIGRNLIHASDSVENAIYELGLYFNENEYVNWSPISEEWLYE